MQTRYLSCRGPLDSTSRISIEVIGEEHYAVARAVQKTLQRYKELQDIIAILGIEELSEDDKAHCCTFKEAAKIPEPAVPCCGKRLPAKKGNMFKTADSIKGFKAIMDGQYDEFRNRHSTWLAD